MNKQKVLLIMDIIEIILLIVALFVFTIVFKIVGSSIRYLFLIGDLFVVYTFSKTLSSLENHLL